MLMNEAVPGLHSNSFALMGCCAMATELQTNVPASLRPAVPRHDHVILYSILVQGPKQGCKCCNLKCREIVKEENFFELRCFYVIFAAVVRST